MILKLSISHINFQYFAFSSEIMYINYDEVSNMERSNYLKQIRNRIQESSQGSVFITSDFLDIANTQVVNQALSRLTKEKLILRVMRGIYEFPKYSEFLEEFVAPDPNKVAEAIARNYGWTIVPNGNTALNQLGLSTQVPSVWSYVSDGTYKSYKYDHISIEFKRTTNREITQISYKSALVIQGLKKLGKNNLKDSIFKLNVMLDDQEKEKLLIESQRATSWIYEAIKKMIKGGG